MSFKRMVAISLCLSWLSAGAMDTQKQTITIKQPVKYINSKPIIIPISTVQAKPVRLSTQQASALVHAYQSLHKPAGSVMQQLQQRLPACRQTAVPQSLQRYTNNAHEYVYIKTSHQTLLSARTTQIDKVGKPYAMYTNCICPAGGGKPVVEVICTNNPQDMVRVTTLIAQRYINQDKSNAVIESNLVMDDSVANMSGIPTIGSVVELSKTDQAKYHAMLQVIEGKIRYEDIDMCMEGLRKMDAEAFTHVYYANDDDPACMLHLSPAGKLFADEKHTTIPGSSMLTDGLQTVSSGIFTVNIQESSGDVRQDPFLNAYKRHYEELRMQYEESCSFQHALEREGLLTFAQLTETELVWAEEKFSRPLAQLETALRDPNVMEKYGMFADIKNKLENLISACREELAYRSECLQKFKTALAQLPQETLYIIQDNLVAKSELLKKFIDTHKPLLCVRQHKYSKAEKKLGSVYGYWDRGYLPGFMQKAFNYGYELFHPLDEPEEMLVEKYNYNLGEVRKLRPQINAYRNALDKADAQLNIVRNLIVKNECYHVQNQQKLIADRLPELNALKVQYANPRNSFERDLVHAVDLTLENQEAVVVTRLAFEPQFCTFVTSMGSKPEVFNNRKDSHLGFSINQYCINTINSMLDAQQQTGSSPFAREAMKTVVRGCTEVAQYAREGEYTKAIRLAEEVYSLANTVEASPEIQTAVYQTIEKQLAVHADEETVIFLPEAVPFKLEDIVDMTTTAAMRLGENSKVDRELACKLLVQLAPAIGKGVANGLINLANPFNALLVPLYKIRLAAEVAGFTLRESLNFAQYLHYKMSGQQDTADSMLAKCAEPFKHVAAGWEKLDDAAKVEMISQVVTEIVVGGKVSEICNRFEKSVLDKAAQYVSNPTIAKAIKVVSDFRGNGGKQQLAHGVVEDVEVVKVKDGKQVVARYDRYIQTMRLKLDKLEKYWDAKLTAIKEPLFNKANSKHLFGIEKTQKVRASGDIEARYAGFHHDKNWKLVKNSKVKFLTEPKVDPKTGIVYVEKIAIEGVQLSPPKTFFPAEWSRKKVIDKIVEASKNIDASKTKIKGMRQELTGVTSEGMEVLMIIDENKTLVTAFPIFKE